LSKGSTELTDDAESVASPGVPRARSPADNVLAWDENERRRSAAFTWTQRHYV
jgi:hypothetical protein